MQLLSDASTIEVSADGCARTVVETVPLVMQFIRRQMRAAKSDELSIAQLRTLYFISTHDRASLSSAAGYIGLSLPAMSRLVDFLVRKNLVTRNACEDDRRHVRLCVTELGQAALDVSLNKTQEMMTREMASLSPGERGTIAQAMETLRQCFEPNAVKS